MKSDDVYVPNYIKRKITPIKMDGNGEPTEINSIKVIDNNQHVNFDVPLEHNNIFDDNGMNDIDVPEAFETSKDLSYYNDEKIEEESKEEISDEYLLMYKKRFLTSGSKEKIEEDITSILLNGLDLTTSVEKEDLTVFKKINIGIGVYLKE